MGTLIGVDIGGTFTDFFVFDAGAGLAHTLKVLSTPDKPGSEVVTGIGELLQRFGVHPADVSYFTHGTTVGVNTVIQRKGANLALFATAGFEDVLEIARLKMPDPYDLFSRRPDPLVPRERAYGIKERILADGTVSLPVDEESVSHGIEAAKAAGADTIIVSLLHAYANAAHEHRIRDIIKALAPEMDVALSSDVWPVIREYERTVTATVAGYVQCRVATYIGSLQTALKDAGVTCEPMITKSNGGVMRAELGKTSPIQMLLSGTASGVIGASHIAALAEEANVLSYDVGGTSADVAIILDDKPRHGTGEFVGDFPIYVPTVSVTSIGAGGGSIAYVDALGVLKVGPMSAGSKPGPACYGLGGTDATITDAYAVCGWLGFDELGYGAVSLDHDAAKTAVAHIGKKCGMALHEAAEAIIKVSISGIFLEVSKLFSGQGADPRHFALLPFGGAGPMTACLLARDLGLSKIIVPPTPGVLAAYGGIIADIRNDFIQTALLDVSPNNGSQLQTYAKGLRDKAVNWLRGEQEHDGGSQLLFSADMRYRGQSYEIEVPIEEDWIEAGNFGNIAQAFHREHARVYEYADEKADVQIVNLRAVITAKVPKPKLSKQAFDFIDAIPSNEANVFYDNEWHTAAVFEREQLKCGHRFKGPAIVRQSDCTTCLVDGFDAYVDGFSNLIITRED